jgi:ABC-type spermidine/putrescine transport system permease subunit II
VTTRRLTGIQLTYLIAVLLVLMAPLVVIGVMSFNSSPYGTLPFQGTFEWYRVLASASDLLQATILSLELGAVVAVTCGVLGVGLSLWLVRYARRLGRIAANSLLVATITVPWLILAVAMLLILNAVGIGRSYLGLYLGDVAVALPYTVFIMVARLMSMDASVEEAAASLGARPVTVFGRITFPIAAPALLAGTVMAFVTCFNNFIIQYFLAPYGVETLPLDVFGQIRVGYKPDIDALATIITLLTLIPVIILQRVVYVRRKPVAQPEEAAARG